MSQIKCPICSDLFRKDQNVVICPSCQRIHHNDCWEYNLYKCGIFGCNGSGILATHNFPQSTIDEHFESLSTVGSCNKVAAVNDAINPILSSNPIQSPRMINQVNVSDYWITTLLVSSALYGFIGIFFYILVIIIPDFSSLRITEIGYEMLIPILFIVSGCTLGLFSSFVYNLIRSTTGVLRKSDYILSVLAPTGVFLFLITGGFLLLMVLSLITIVIFFFALAGGG